MKSVILINIAKSPEDLVSVVAKNEPSKDQLIELVKTRMKSLYGEAEIEYKDFQQSGDSKIYKFEYGGEICAAEVKRVPLFEFDKR